MIAEQEMDRAMMTLKIIWFAMLLSLAVYLLAGLLGAPGISASMSGEAFSVLRTVLYVVGFATLIAAGTLRKLLCAGISRTGGPDPAPQPVSLPKYTTAVIISLALCESVGIYGLVLFFLGKNSLDLYLLLGVSAAAMIYYRPRKDELLTLLQETR
jgi:F0F1-type ATP synthase membrane subunit c/vacuolar-type H+-ATPase subunit K